MAGQVDQLEVLVVVVGIQIRLEAEMHARLVLPVLEVVALVDALGSDGLDLLGASDKV